MSSTNKTPNLGLSQFVGTDHPTWLYDYNTDMQKIDEAVEKAQNGGDDNSASIKALQNDTELLKQNVNGLQQSYNTHSVAIQQNAERLTNVETVNAQQNTRLNNLEGDVVELQGAEAWVFVGDSYAANPTNYMNTIKALNPNRKIYDASKTGAGFTVEGNTFLQNLQAIVSTITDIKKVGKVIFIGGGNDLSASGDSQRNAITACVQYCKATFPNATVYIGFLWGSLDTFSATAKASTITNYIGAAYRNDCVYMTGIENICHKYQIIFGTGDGHHPNATGAEYIGRLINGFLVSGTAIPTASYTTTANITAANGVTFSLQPTISQTQKDGTIYCDCLTWTPQFDTDLPANTWRDMGTYNIMYENSDNKQIAEVIAVDAEGKFHELIIRLNHGTIAVNSPFFTIPANTRVRFRVNSFALNADYC